MRAWTFVAMAVSSACGPAAVRDAAELSAFVSAGDNSSRPTTRVELSFGPNAGCPSVAANTIARFNGAALPLCSPGKMQTVHTMSGNVYSACVTPAWVVSEAPAPPAQEVVEVSGGGTSLRAVFDTPQGTSRLVNPPDGVLPSGVESAMVLVEASLASGAATSTSFDIACENLQVRQVSGGGERREFSVEAIRTRSGFLPLPSGTHHCAVRFAYSLTPAECPLESCTLQREGANIFAAAQPDQRLGFDLVVP